MRSLVCFIISVCFMSIVIFCCAESSPTDAFYDDLKTQIELKKGETIHLIADQTYYSGSVIHRGNTGTELKGACVIHSAATILSNYTQKQITGQTIAEINNKDISSPKKWISFVSWGKIGKKWNVDFQSYNMTSYRTYLKRHGTSMELRRNLILTEAKNQLIEHGGNTGIVIQFNSSGSINGSGHRHSVVLLGWVEKENQVIDLLVCDSATPPPTGACVRLEDSGLVEILFSAKQQEKLYASGENIPLRLMDYLVTCRWPVEKNTMSQKAK